MRLPTAECPEAQARPSLQPRSAHRWNRSSPTGFILARQYALIALGLTLIFALMNVLNFAHGQMYVLGGFVTYTVYGQLGMPFVVALLASGVTLAVVGGAHREIPLRDRSSAKRPRGESPCSSPPASPSSSTR